MVVPDAAEIVIGDVGAARLLGLGIFGAKLDLGIGVDMDDALGHGRDDDQPDLLQRVGGRGQHLAQARAGCRRAAPAAGRWWRRRRRR